MVVRKKILLVEDNESIVKGLKYLLEKKYILDIAFSKKEAEILILNKYDIIILDIGLTDGSGFDIGEKVKDIPIIFLTANDMEESIVKGLSIGEDYIVKPFKNSELMARIEKVIKRNEKNLLYFEDVTIDLNKVKVFYLGEECDLTHLEFEITCLLFENPEKVISREQILSVIWDSNNKFVNDNTLTVYIKRIREKLNNRYIKTVKGVGYMVTKDDK